jgi:hypothetical protein
MKVTMNNQSIVYNQSVNFQGKKMDIVVKGYNALKDNKTTLVIETGKVAFPVMSLIHSHQLNPENFLALYTYDKLYLDFVEYCINYIKIDKLNKPNPENYYAWSKLNLAAQYRKSKYCETVGVIMLKISEKIDAIKSKYKK